MHMRSALVVLVLASSCGEAPLVRPLVEGAWEGTYECGADSKKASLGLNEDDEGVVEGEAFLDYQIVLLGTPYLLTGRGAVDGEFDADDNEYTGAIDIFDNAQGLADFEFTLELNEAADELEGVFEIRNSEGEVTQSCDANLEKIDVED